MNTGLQGTPVVVQQAHVHPHTLPRQYLYLLLLVIILPNAPFTLAASYFEVYRPSVNYDYMVAALLITTRFSLFGLLLLLISMLSDIFSLVQQIFPAIQQPSHLIDLAPMLFMAPQPYIIVTIFLFVYILATPSLIYCFRHKYSLMQGLVIANLALALFLYHTIVTPEQGSPSADNGVQDRPWVSSQLLNYATHPRGHQVMALMSPAQKGPKPDFAPVTYTGATAAWYRLPVDTFPDRLLLILNESWGANSDPRITQALLTPLLMHKDRLSGLEYGDTEFVGATISAELRELCGLRPNHYFMSRIRTGFENCLPNRLQQAGYDVHALHGALGKIYKRRDWYPQVGLHNTTFFDSKVWPAKCESFPGACDLDMRSEITEYFQQPGKRFMYWLTLNTHFAYSMNDLRHDVFDCPLMGVEEDSETCRYLKLQAQFFHGLSEILDDPRMADVTVRIIGDHAPQISKKSEKRRYFKGESIGWLEFSVSGDFDAAKGKLTARSTPQAQQH